MGFWIIGTGGGGGGGGGGTTENIQLYDDLSAQIDGVKDTFTVARGNFTGGTVACSIGGLVMRKGPHFTEFDAATGKIKTARPLDATDIPLIVSYKYA